MSKPLRHTSSAPRPALAALVAVSASLGLSACEKPAASARRPDPQPLTVSVAPIEIASLKAILSALNRRLGSG